MISNQIHDKSLVILEKTEDGNKLADSDLNLVEGAVNGFLSTRGEVVFHQLYQKILDGDYELPWFCEVENLTRGTNGDRSVFWKGVRVEHYDHDFWGSEDWKKRMQEDAQRLGKICQYLEDSGIEVNFDNYLAESRRRVN